MFNAIQKKLALILVAAALTIPFAAKRAFAADTVVVTQVAYDSGRLAVYTATSGYYGMINGCANAQNIDTLKTWVSMAQTALLSGKSLQIYFTTCSTGEKLISSMTLLK